MIVYLLKSSTILFVLYLFYKLFLEEENMHVFKRYYLLVSLVASFGIPWLTYVQYVEPVQLDIQSPIFKSNEIDISSVDRDIPLYQYFLNIFIPILWLIYGFGVVLMSFRFSKNLIDIYTKIKHNTIVKAKQYSHVLIHDLIIPHTFLNYIFLHKQSYTDNRIPKAVLIHEETHALQKHSIDILLIELIQIVFWFNPLFYFIKKSIKLNHEFLADQTVLNNGVQIPSYQKILLMFSTNSQQPQLTNAINYSLIKKRFTVMKTQTTKRSIWLRSLVILPLLAVLIYGFSEKVIVEKELNKLEIYQNALQVKKNEKGATEALMNEYNDYMDSSHNRKSINHSKYERIVAIYGIMTEDQRKTVKKYLSVPSIDLSKTKAKIPSINKFNSWKSSNKYALWLDNKYIDNSILESYKNSDISFYHESFVYENARSEKFPQSYQISLFTKNGYEENFINSTVNKYRLLSKSYYNNIDVFLKSDRVDNSELKLQKQQLDILYSQFTSKELKKNTILEAAPVPREYSISQSTMKAKNLQKTIWIQINSKKQILLNKEKIVTLKTIGIEIKNLIATYGPEQLANTFLVVIEAPGEIDMGFLIDVSEEIRKVGVKFIRKYVGENNTTQEKIEKASKEQIGEYNKIAKKYNDMPQSHMTISKKEVGRLKYLYRIMSVKQRKNAEPYPVFPPPPPTPNAPTFERSERIPPPPLPENPTFKQKEKNKSTVRGYVGQTQAPVRIYEYDPKTEQVIEIIENPNVITGLVEVVEVPSSPSSPDTPMELLLEMANKDARFYYNGEIISSKEAIKLMKEKRNINLAVISGKSKKSIVNLYNKSFKTKNLITE